MDPYTKNYKRKYDLSFLLDRINKIPSWMHRRDLIKLWRAADAVADKISQVEVEERRTGSPGRLSKELAEDFNEKVRNIEAHLLIAMLQSG